MKIKIIDSLDQIPKPQWNALIGDHFPFAEYDFLHALEQGRCVGKEAGWIPHYITAWHEDQLEGAIYLYLKNNSYGEYIFDWAWANAYAQHGMDYYPKLVSAVPFTPATGLKILTHPNADAAHVGALMLEKVKEIAIQKKYTSIHFLFIQEKEQALLEQSGFFIRHSCQFHWQNQDYVDFEHFLSSLKGKRRKEIIRERRKVKESQIEVQVLTGDALKLEHCEAMYNFYLSTIFKMGAIDYLSLEFFRDIFVRMKEHIVLMLAKVEDRWVAGAINYRKGDCLYGRYWGCLEEFKNLHFELCYYQAIDYAIQHKIQLFEAGAQGEHKIQRGFLPQITYSAHWMRHSGFHGAIQDFVLREKEAIDEGLEAGESHLPYKLLLEEEKKCSTE